MNRILHRPQATFTVFGNLYLDRGYSDQPHNRVTQHLPVSRSMLSVWKTCSQRWASPKHPKRNHCYCITLGRKPAMCWKLLPYQNRSRGVMSTKLPSNHLPITSVCWSSRVHLSSGIAEVWWEHHRVLHRGGNKATNNSRHFVQPTMRRESEDTFLCGKECCTESSDIVWDRVWNSKGSSASSCHVCSQIRLLAQSPFRCIII